MIKIFSLPDQQLAEKDKTFCGAKQSKVTNFCFSFVPPSLRGKDFPWNGQGQT